MSLCCCDTAPPPPPPPTAACCLPRDDPTNPEGCEILSEADCTTRNGRWLGNSVPPVESCAVNVVDCALCPACDQFTGMYPDTWNIPNRSNFVVTFVDVRLDASSAFQPGGIVYEELNTQHFLPANPPGAVCFTRKELLHGGLFFPTVIRVNYVNSPTVPGEFAIETWIVNAAAGLSGTPRINEIGPGVNCDAQATYPLVYANAGSMVYHGPG